VRRFNVTEQPTAWWTGQQIIETIPEDTAVRYLLRDWDYGEEFRQRIRGLGLGVLSAPANPWKRAYVERLIGSIVTSEHKRL
jgi:hypothetical protein